MTAQPELFKLQPSADTFRVPPPDDTRTTMCWDCAFFQRDRATSLDGRCQTRRQAVVYEGTCGRFVKAAKREMFDLRAWEE